MYKVNPYRNCNKAPATNFEWYHFSLVQCASCQEGAWHWAPEGHERMGCMEGCPLSIVVRLGEEPRDFYRVSICESGLGSRNSVRLSVCLSVIHVDCYKTKWCTADILIQYERAITLLLWYQLYYIHVIKSPQKISTLRCTKANQWPSPCCRQRNSQILIISRPRYPVITEVLQNKS